LKNYEKKSFFTTLILFFIPLFVLSSIVLYMYYGEKIQEMENNILYEMKDYSYDFKGDNFSLDIVEDDKSKEIFKVYHLTEGLTSYFEIPSKGPYLLKIVHNQLEYENLKNKILKKIFQVSIVIFLFIFFISLGFSFYALRPMREAIHLLENFLKDLIHDLNTPATSILLNAKLLRKRGDFQEIERIELCAKGIASLYKNLELMSPANIKNDEKVYLNESIKNKIEILNKIYPSIHFVQNSYLGEITSNKNAVDRILDNVLTNACKYNKKNGYVYITISKNRLEIKDTGIGIKNTNKVFQRYYKENTNGLGIGMNIVKQLCDILNITIEVKSVINEGTIVNLTFH